MDFRLCGDPQRDLMRIGDYGVLEFASNTFGGETLVTPGIIAVANQKGGVGKTTTVVNLAAYLALAGKRVLMIDLDPQGNASTAIGIDRDDRARTIYDALCDTCPLAECVRATSVENLFAAPATIDLAALEVESSGIAERDFMLRTLLQSADAAATLEQFDFVLIDCPPTLGVLTINAFAAADSLLVPLQAEFLALEGLTDLLRTVDRVTQRVNPKLTIDGVLMTMIDRRNNLSAAVIADARQYLGELVYQAAIPRNVRLSEAPSHGLPIASYDPRCAGALAYAQAAQEFLNRRRA